MQSKSSILESKLAKTKEDWELIKEINTISLNVALVLTGLSKDTNQFRDFGFLTKSNTISPYQVAHIVLAKTLEIASSNNLDEEKLLLQYGEFLNGKLDEQDFNLLRSIVYLNMSMNSPELKVQIESFMIAIDALNNQQIKPENLGYRNLTDFVTDFEMARTNFLQNLLAQPSVFYDGIAQKVIDSYFTPDFKVLDQRPNSVSFDGMPAYNPISWENDLAKFDKLMQGLLGFIRAKKDFVTINHNDVNSLGFYLHQILNTLTAESENEIILSNEHKDFLKSKFEEIWKGLLATLTQFIVKDDYQISQTLFPTTLSVLNDYFDNKLVKLGLLKRGDENQLLGNILLETRINSINYYARLSESGPNNITY